MPPVMSSSGVCGVQVRARRKIGTLRAFHIQSCTRKTGSIRHMAPKGLSSLTPCTMFNLWLLRANKFQSSWASSDVRMRVEARQITALYIKVILLRERHLWVRLRAGGPHSVYRTASCDKFRIMSLAFIWMRHNPDINEESQSHFTWQQAKQRPPFSFLSVLLSSTFNVWHFDTEHPISRVLVGWLYMQIGW